MPALDEQIAAIRTGLDDAGIITQEDRRAFVKSAVLFEAASLRELTAVQARRVIDQLKAGQSPKAATNGSLWDDREHDTWIDKL